MTARREGLGILSYPFHEDQRHDHVGTFILDGPMCTIWTFQYIFSHLLLCALSLPAGSLPLLWLRDTGDVNVSPLNHIIIACRNARQDKCPLSIGRNQSSQRSRGPLLLLPTNPRSTIVSKTPLLILHEPFSPICDKRGIAFQQHTDTGESYSGDGLSRKPASSMDAWLHHCRGLFDPSYHYLGLESRVDNHSRKYDTVNQYGRNKVGPTQVRNVYSKTSISCLFSGPHLPF